MNLTDESIAIIERGDVLEDIHIDHFLRLMYNHYQEFTTFQIWQIQTSKISEIPREQRHIQILFKNPTIIGDIGHWICSYYDGKSIFIYDSLNRKCLAEENEQILRILHPYFFLSKGEIYYPNVQMQQNCQDCGVFAIAFAVSLSFELNPAHLTYYTDKMRHHLVQMFKSNRIKLFPCKVNSVPLTIMQKYEFDRNILINQECLNSDHVNYFQEIMAYSSHFEPQTPLYLQRKSLIVEVPHNKKHIQILFQEAQSKHNVGHWVCSYYDTKSIYIYDSLNSKTLHKDCEIYLKKLHGYHFDQQKPILFPTVQNQTNAIDCGLYAIAFAVSIFFGDKPDEIVYKTDLMRSHLLKIFDNRIIERFPKTDIMRKHNFHKDVNVQIYTSPATEPLCLSNKLSYDTILKENVDTNSIKTGIEVIIQNKFSYSQKSILSSDIVTIKGEINNSINVPSQSSQGVENRDVSSNYKGKYKRYKEMHKEDISTSNTLYYESHQYSQKSILSGDVDTVQVQIDSKNNNKLKEKSQRYYEKNKEEILKKIKLRYEMNNEEILKKNKLRYKKNNEEILKKNKLRYEKNKEEILNKNKLRYEKNKEEILNKIKLRYEKNKEEISKKKKLHHEKNKEEISKRTKLFYHSHKNLNKKRKLDMDVSIDKLSKTSKICDQSKNEEKSSQCVQTSDFGLQRRTDSIQLQENKNSQNISICTHQEQRLQTNNEYTQQKKQKIKENNNKYKQTSKTNISKYNLNYPEKSKEKISSVKREYDEKKQKNISIMKGKYINISKERNLINSKVVVANKIKKKYTTINHKQNTTKLLINKEKYIRNIIVKLDSAASERRIEAENLVLKSIYVRDYYIVQLKTILRNLKNKIEVSLTRLGDIPIPLNVECASTALCGLHKHAITTEPYFLEAAYRIEFPLFDDFNELDKNVENKEQEKGQRRIWQCDDYCKVVDPDILIQIADFFQELLQLTYIDAYAFLKTIDICSNQAQNVNKLGHPNECHRKPLLCTSKFLKLSILSPHYPHLRTIKRIIYKLKHCYKRIDEVDVALNDGDVDALKNIALEAKNFAMPFRSIQNDNGVCLDESKLKLEFATGIKEYTKIATDPPTIPCISCERLFCARNVEPFNKNENNVIFELLGVESDILRNVQQLFKSQEGNEASICRTCKTNLRKNTMPSTSVLNNLFVEQVPEEILNLNSFEKMLIQRAKAFQTVQKMGTVMNKNLPHHVKIDKVVGRTFHLPLPLEETLKKICPETDPLNVDHEIYILLRSNPSKSKIVWEDYVDINKVWKALLWLKSNNPLYTNITLPSHPEELLKPLKDLDVYYDDEKPDKKDVNEQNRDIDNDLGPDGSKLAALVTQKSPSDAFYDQYTIYPLHGRRFSETDTKLYQMLKIYATNLDVRGKDLDLMCFPDLYPYGKYGQHHQRIKRLRDFDFIKSRLTSKHPQFRLNIQYLFYLLFNNNIRQISAGIFHKLNVVNPRFKYTAGDIMKQLEQDQLESNLNTIFSRLRGTEAYWKKVRNELNCMMNEYGPATFFVTLSPGEWMWSALSEYIKEVDGWENDSRSISELIVADPVSASRFIHNEFQAMLKYILSSANPIGQVNHYYYVCEYQGRGLPHYHCLFWIKNAPIYGTASNEEVQQFILKYITCTIPDKRISPELYRRVMAYQQHKHNNYCMRKKKTMYGFKSSCRFGFPRPVTNQLVFRDVSVAIANRSKLKNKSRFYDLPRKIEEQNINDYMPALLILWEGNNDAQFIGESSYLLTKYVSSYGTKGEKSVVDFTDEQTSKSLCSRLWSFSLRALNHRECGAIEAADTLLGHPLHATDPDTIVRWLDVKMIRSRKLKPICEVKQLSPNSTNIFYDSFIDSHYLERPKELESMCLYDFAKWFDIFNKKPVYKAEFYEMRNGLFCKKRKKPYLINHWKYKPESEPESYYHALLLLFQPWRDVDELKGNEDTFVAAFKKKQFDLADAMKYHDKCLLIQQAMDDMNKMIEKEELKNSSINTQSSANNFPDGCVPRELENALKDFQDIADKGIVTEQDLKESTLKFNEDQARVFHKITSVLESSEKRLRMFVSGPGGTGKSFVIETLVSWNKIKRDKNTAVTAPTGIAAYNVHGLTIHRLLQLPVEHGCTAKYKELSSASRKQIRQTLSNVDLIIIDEISMVSNIMLMYIHLRLTEIFDTSEAEDGWFGKMNIIVFGDLLQLPPVHEKFAFVETNKVKIVKYIGAMNTFNLWALFEYEELTINMRQKNDKTYSEILSRIRLGLITKSDIQTLQTRNVQFCTIDSLGLIQELCEYLHKLPADTVCLLPTRNMCNILNTHMLQKIDSEEIILLADDSFRCAKNLHKKVLNVLEGEDSNNFCGIDRIIKIK